jgi:hypothetical protein
LAGANGDEDFIDMPAGELEGTVQLTAATVLERGLVVMHAGA